MIPVIDLSSEDSTDKLHRACLDTGFFVAEGHRLDDLIDAVFDASRRFFALPQGVKEQTPRIEHYGFVPHVATAVDTARASNNTEFLDLGLQNEVRLPELAGFEQAVREYQAAALRVGVQIIGSLATALGLEADFFEKAMANPQCRLRFLHYPPVRPNDDGTLPVPTNSHTDYGLITLLATDGVPGLEVRTIDGEWLPINAPAGSLIVNLGDMLARWTNDRYRSTPHRVVGPSVGERFSIPLFVNPDPGTIIECIPTCVDRSEPLSIRTGCRRRVSSEAYRQRFRTLR